MLTRRTLVAGAGAAALAGAEAHAGGRIPPPMDGAAPPLNGYRLVLDEDWSNGVDEERWKIFVGPDPAGQPGMFYERERLTLESGVLRLRADGDGKKFIGAGLASKFRFKYGYFEFKTRILPKPGPGWLCCTWLFGGDPYPAHGEIDVNEQFTSQPHYTLHSVHGRDARGKRLFRNYAPRLERSMLDGQWYTCGALWVPGEVRFYVDGEERWRTPLDEFRQGFRPMEAVINVWSTLPERWPHQAAHGPCTFECASYRVWQPG